MYVCTCIHVRCTYHNRLRAEALHFSDSLRQHPQFLEVDQSINFRIVAIVKEGEVFLYNGEKWYQRRLSAALEFTVLGHVVERVHEGA